MLNKKRIQRLNLKVNSRNNESDLNEDYSLPV